MIVIPELALYEILEGLLIHISRDLENNNADLSKSMISKIFGSSKNGKRVYFDQAKDLFSRKVDHPRKIQTHMFFPKEQKGVPTISVILPGEQSMYNEIGVGESGIAEEIDIDSGRFTPTQMRRFEGQLVILITSDNVQEVLTIYHLLKAMFISIFDAQSFAGLENPVLSGRDVTINEQNNPPHLFTRALSIKHMHQVNVPRFFSEEDIRNIVLEGKAKITTDGE